MVRRLRLRLAFACAAVLAVALAGVARADGAPPPAATPKPPSPPKAPKYENLRFKEDWSAFLATCPADRCDLSDRLKAVAVGRGDVWFDIGGQVRARYESWDNQAFGAPAGEDAWGLLRGRAHVDLHLGTHVRVFAEGLYADADGRDVAPRAVDENHGDLQNLFAEGRGALGHLDVGVWAGRHELLFGKQRLLGPLDWANVRRTFDGGGGWAKGCNWRVDAFFVRPVVVEADEGDEADDAVELAGAHYVNSSVKDRTFEAYVYYLHKDVGTWAKVGEEETRVTVGGLCTGPICGTRLNYDAEVAYQAGTWGDADVSAWMATAELGWKPGGRGQPRLAVGADYASGDDGAGGDLGTFNQLYPTGHLWFGWADLIGRQNVMAARLTATAKPTDKLLVRFDAHQFWRASTDDAVYNAGGGVLRAAGGSDAREVGTELDLQAKVTVDRHVEVEAGVSYVLAGTFLEETGPDEDVTFLYLQVTFTF